MADQTLKKDNPSFIKTRTDYFWIIDLFAYTLTGLSGALAFHLSGKGVLLVTLVCILQGAVILFTSYYLNWPLYLKRFCGSFLPGLMIVFFYRMLMPSDGVYALMSAMFMPIASGTTFVQGICHTNKKAGWSMLLEAVIIALCLELGAFISMKIGGAAGWI